MADNFTDRMVAITDQTRFIDPYQQRVFQYDTESSDVFLSRVVNSLLRIFGDDVVINGFEYSDYQLLHTDHDAVIRVPAGTLIQDTTLVEFNKDTHVQFESLSGLNTEGKLVINIRYNYLHTIEENPAYICVNYIAPDGSPRFEWDLNRDRTVVGILEFTKDEDDKVIGLTLSDDKSILISGQTYYLYGINPNKRELTPYLLRMVYADANTSITFDNGLHLVGDIDDPGENKYYGTDISKTKGWYDFPAIFPDGTKFTQLSDTPNTYYGSAGKFLRVNNSLNGIEFVKVTLPNEDDFVSIYKDQIIYSSKIIDGDLYILGNCNIKGTVTYINETELSVNNPEILLNVGETGTGVSAIFSGLRVKRGTLPDALLRFNETTDTWQVGFEGKYPYSDIALKDEVNDYIDEGLITEYQGLKYRAVLENGNLFLRQLT